MNTKDTNVAGQPHIQVHSIPDLVIEDLYTAASADLVSIRGNQSFDSFLVPSVYLDVSVRSVDLQFGFCGDRKCLGPIVSMNERCKEDASADHKPGNAIYLVLHARSRASP